MRAYMLRAYYMDYEQNKRGPTDADRMNIEYWSQELYKELSEGRDNRREEALNARKDVHK